MVLMKLRKRENKVTFRLNDDELELLKNKADKASMSVQKFLLYLVLNKEVKELPSIDYYHLINQFNELSSYIKNLIALSFEHQEIDKDQLEKILENLSLKMKELDEAAEKAGGFTSTVSADDIHYNYREISRYCKEKGIEPIDMTIRELNRFVVE